MRLQLMTWLEVEDYLTRSSGILVPIGSTEQHGPTGLMGTDALTAEAIAWRVGDRVGAAVGPTLTVGMAIHHMAFSGTLTLRPSTLVAVVRDWVVSLHSHGFDRILFVNGHGGNVATVRAAFMEIHGDDAVRQKQGDLRLHLLNWWEGGRVRRMCRELYGDREGSHATPSEIAVIQALHPDRIPQAPLEPAKAPQSAFQGPADYRRRHPDGRMGSDPSLANPDDGRRIIQAAIDDLSEAYGQFVAG